MIVKPTPAELPFHAWKSAVIAAEKAASGVETWRERSWYYTEYGNYCLACRRLINQGG